MWHLATFFCFACADRRLAALPKNHRHTFRSVFRHAWRALEPPSRPSTFVDYANSTGRNGGGRAAKRHLAAEVGVLKDRQPILPMQQPEAFSEPTRTNEVGYRLKATPENVGAGTTLI